MREDVSDGQFWLVALYGWLKFLVVLRALNFLVWDENGEYQFILWIFIWNKGNFYEEIDKKK